MQWQSCGGDGAQYRIDCRDYPPETRLLSIDSTKAMTMLDWCPPAGPDDNLEDDS